VRAGGQQGGQAGADRLDGGDAQRVAGHRPRRRVHGVDLGAHGRETGPRGDVHDHDAGRDQPGGQAEQQAGEQADAQHEFDAGGAAQQAAAVDAAGQPPGDGCGEHDADEHGGVVQRGLGEAAAGEGEQDQDGPAERHAE
jgi:hypothetical protein